MTRTRPADSRPDTEATESARASELIIQAFRASPDAITISRMRDGMLLDVNRGFQRISGYSRAEAVGRSTEELGIWSAQEWDRMLRALRRDGRIENRSFTFRRKSGELAECLLSTEILEIEDEPCLVTVTRDVTRSKRIEARLRASEEKFAKAFRSSPDAITISRLSDGTFLDVNIGFQQISGYGYEEAVGSRATDLGLWLDDDRERILATLRQSGRIHNAQVRYRMKSGEIRDFLLSAESIELDGEPCLVAVSRDVTEMRQAERERERLVDRLEAQKAELEQFAYTVSHDLKSPLVTILGFVGLAQREAAKVPEIGPFLERIQHAAESMNRNLNELLELSRVGRVMNPPESVRLRELALRAAARLDRQFEERGVELDIAEGMPTVSGDRFRLVELLQNLLENAVKFMGDQPSPRVEVRAESRQEEIVCSVRDNGIGIAARHLEKVYGLFDRLDPSIEGTGVGLALVKRIIEVHGGRTWIESAGPGMGSTVFFTLPRAAGGGSGPGP